MKFNFKKMVLGIGAPMALLLAACGGEEATTSTDSSEAGNANWPEKIVVAQYVNDENEASPAAHTAFRDHLESELGIEVVELDGGGSYAPGIEALASENLDVMLVSPQSFAAAQEKADARLIATLDEDTDYYSMFITQEDNNEINSLEDLEGKSFAFVDAASTSGYLYPKATLISELGLESSRVEESGYYFSNVALSGGHDNSMLGVEMGDYDAAAVASTVYRRAVDAGTVNEDKIKVFAQSVNIPNSSYIVGGHLPDDLVDAIQDAFLTFDDENYFDVIYGKPAARFTAIDDSYYEPAVEAMRLVGALEEE